MSKKISMGMSIVLVLLACVLTFQLTHLYIDNKYKEKLDELQEGQEIFSKLSSLDSTFENYYIGELDNNKILESVMDGYIQGTGDRYAEYMTSEEYVEFMNSMSGNLTGIGITISYSEEQSAIEILRISEKSPAETVGLLIGDMILSVNSVSVEKDGPDAVVSELKGEPGEMVSLTILRDGNTMDFSVVIENITAQAVYSRILADSNLAYVEITSFDLTTSEQFKTTIETLKKQNVQGFVFDLRNNPGGELRCIVEILDYLLPEGIIVRLLDAAGKETTYSSNSDCLDYPMAVIVNKGTASAAELFTAALKDYNKAVIVGQQTYGKGMIQSIIRMKDNSAVCISTGIYNPPFSENYEGVGITPDIVIALPEEYQDINILKIPEEDDTQLQEAIRVLIENSSSK